MDIALARALHVLAVIHWIGGLSFVTLVVLPFARAQPTARQALEAFESVERRFSAQARVSVSLAGVSGLWLTYRMDLWHRFHAFQFWWMSGMLGLWIFFMLMLFVLEPLLHERFARQAEQAPGPVFRRMSRLHHILLFLAALTVLGTVAGSHGLMLF